MLGVTSYRYAECHYAECHYAECRHADCRSTSSKTFSFSSLMLQENWPENIDCPWQLC